MAVPASELLPLVETYFQLEEYPEGEHLGETRTLKQIVTFLEEKCDEQEWGEISTSSDGQEVKKKRNINDKVRRVLKKMPSISSTTGKTTKKRYYKNDSGVWRPDELINRFYGDIFTANEIIAGGNSKSETILSTASSFDSVLALSDFFWWRVSNRMGTEDVLSDLLRYTTSHNKHNWPEPFTVISDRNLMEPAPFDLIEFPERILFLQSEKTKNMDFATFRKHIEYSFSSLKNDSTKWFTHEPSWMENQYFGFRGPVGLADLLDNISKNIQENDTSKISRILKIDPEDVKWLKRQNSSRHNRMPNRTIFTLALLHLNRSLLESIEL